MAFPDNIILKECNCKCLGTLALIIRHLVYFIKPATTVTEDDLRDFLLTRCTVMRSKAQKKKKKNNKMRKNNCRKKKGFEDVGSYI